MVDNATREQPWCQLNGYANKNHERAMSFTDQLYTGFSPPPVKQMAHTGVCYSYIYIYIIILKYFYGEVILLIMWCITECMG